jgi:hypothetical protein
MSPQSTVHSLLPEEERSARPLARDFGLFILAVDCGLWTVDSSL